MSKILELKIDRNEGRPSQQNSAVYYPVSEEFFKKCHEAGNDLVVEARIISQYDEDEINYPSSRVILERQDGKPLVGLIPRV